MGNLCYVLFCIYGCARLFPHFLTKVMYFGIDYPFCRSSLQSLGNIEWTVLALFGFSKYINLIDTFWMVFRKRKVHAAHLVHHAGTLVFMHCIGDPLQPTNALIACFNMMGHASIYYSYYLSDCGLKPKWAK